MDPLRTGNDKKRTKTHYIFMCFVFLVFLVQILNPIKRKQNNHNFSKEILWQIVSGFLFIYLLSNPYAPGKLSGDFMERYQSNCSAVLEIESPVLDKEGTPKFMRGSNQESEEGVADWTSGSIKYDSLLNWRKPLVLFLLFFFFEQIVMVGVCKTLSEQWDSIITGKWQELLRMLE